MKTPTETLEALKNSTINSESNSSSSSSSSSSSTLSSSLSSPASSASLPTSENNVVNSSFLTYFLAAIFVIFVLSILGINIFIYLAKGTQSTTDFIENTASKLDPYIGPFFSNIIKFILSIFVVGYETTLGGQSAAEFSAGVVGSGLTALKPSSLTPTSVKETQPSSSPNQEMTPQMQAYYNEQQQQQKEQQEYVPNTSNSTNGWCYVGEDEGYRSCLEINPSTTSCASGQVYSSQQKCLQP
jgi:hypothetical protein